MDQLREQKHVFLSHANADKPRLRRLVSRLLDEDIPLWIDRPEELGLDERFMRCGRIRTGADWQAEIDAALASSACVLFVLSEASNAAERSDALFREFDHGVRNDSLVLVAIDPPSRLKPISQFRIRQSRDLSAFASDPPEDRSTQAKWMIVLQEIRNKLSDAGSTAERGAAFVTSQQSDGIAPLQPYLTDRVSQQRFLAEALSPILAKSLIPPQTFVALGYDDDCLDSFVLQVRHVRLPAVLPTLKRREGLQTCTLVWAPEDSSDVSRLDFEAQALLAEHLRLEPGATAARLAHRIVTSRSPWLLQLNLSLEAGPRWCCEAARAWTRLWLQPELANLEHPVVTLLCISAPSPWLARWLARRPLARIRAELTLLKGSSAASSCLHVLPTFRPLIFSDVEVVIHALDDGIDREAFKKRLRRAFSYLGVLPGRRMSMFEAASCIKQLAADPVLRVKAKA
jgi:hypothetical protein